MYFVVKSDDMSSAFEKERDVRNFRSWYYDNLGLRGVEQRKALDLLLKDDEIGMITMIAIKIYRQ